MSYAFGRIMWCSAVALGLAAGVVVAQQPLERTALLDSPNEEWLTYGGDYAETHFSPLDQIDDSNVERLGRACTANLFSEGA